MKEREKFILLRIRAFGDEGAFEVLVREHGEKLRKFLELKLPTREDSQDAYSEIWTRFWNYAQSTQIESITGLLFTIARNLIAEFYRTRGRKPEQLWDPVVMAEVHVVHPDTINQIDVSLLKEFIRRLDETDSEIIFLRYIEGHRVKDIAEKIGKTENATSVKLHRALTKLRVMIQKKFEDV